MSGGAASVGATWLHGQALKFEETGRASHMEAMKARSPDIEDYLEPLRKVATAAFP